MAETGFSVESETVKSSDYAAVHQALYSIRFNKYIKDLGKEKKNLMLTRKRIQERAQIAQQEAKQIDVMVEKWLEDANTLIEEVEKLEQKVKANKTCCFGRCPNFIWRYHVGKQLAEKAKAVIELIQRSNFEEFAHSIKFFSSEGFIYFENTRMTYDQLLETLKDDEVSMIGLYGMAGCGKTTLVKQLVKVAEKNFNKVAFAVVSNNLDVQKIQGDIASYLGMKLEEEEASERARRLWARLTSGENILIILDDVREKLDLEAIGIPFGENSKGCNVLLTTRCVGVCTLMGCQRTIPLSLLNEGEAWTLFQKHAGIIDKSSLPIAAVAKLITKECKGLPFAIATLASTLKGKSSSEWKEALENLREYTPMDVEESLINACTCLMLIYDNLKNEEVKSFFLLCSVFPEDFEIHEEYLAIYGIGLSLFGEVSSYERARNQVCVAKNKLIDSCLLLKSSKYQCVKMHHLVRDVALCIAKKEKKVIIGVESSGRLLKKNSALEDNTIRYLWCDQIDKLSDQLNCPKLEFLCARVLKDSILPDRVFKTMKDLRVLLLWYEGYYCRKQGLSWAKSIQWLTNLRCLFLEGLQLGDISFLGSLKRLENLMLWNCSFDVLPNEISELPKLRLLDLYGCEIKYDPYEVIGRCSQLEEFFLIKFVSRRWVEIGLGSLDKNNRASGLQSYHIRIILGIEFAKEAFSITRGLSTRNIAFTSSATINYLVQRAQFLHVYEIMGYKNFIPDIQEGGMNELIELNLRRLNIECLVDTSNPSFKVENVFSKLVKLDIWFMDGLETLWRGPHVLKMNLSSLKELSLKDCPMLTSVFTCAVAQSLVVLEEIYIRKCHHLKHIVRDEEKDNDQKNSASIFPKLKKLSVYDCDELEYLIPVSFAGGLVQLESLIMFDARKLIHVFGQSSTNHEDHNQNRFRIINLPLLKELNLQFLPNIKAICPENYYPTWPSLKQLEWLYCEQLKVVSINKSIDGDSQVITQQGSTPTEEQQLGSNVMHDSQIINEVALSETMQSIERISVSYCKIEGIFQLLEHHIGGSDLQPLTSCLKYLSLSHLGELVYICKGPRKHVSLQNLQEINVYGCAKLKFIFSASIFRSLPQLEKLCIGYCPQLEQIIEDGENHKFLNHTEINEMNHCLKNASNEEFHNAPENSVFPRLRRLEIDRCGLLKYILPVCFARDLVKLEIMEIHRCSVLEKVFAGEESDIEDGQQAIILPNLKILRLRELPNLINVCKGFKLESCHDREVSNCPKLTSTTAPFKDLPQESQNRVEERNKEHKK